MKLGRIGKGQEGKPSIIAFEFEIIIPGRDGHRQFTVITFLTVIVPYFAPHVAAGFEPLNGSLTCEAGFAYGVIDGQLKRCVAVGQWKPKT